MKDQHELIEEALSKLFGTSGASASVDRAKTGRILDYHKPHEILADRLAAEWMSLNSIDEIMKHPARKRFENVLSGVPVVSTLEIMYRGRHFDPADTSRNVSSSFGPPPPEACLEAGRYNSAGSSVLYLASTNDGVRLEVQPPPGRVLMSQAFLVPPSVRIADLTNNSIDPFVGNAFDRAEHMEATYYFRSNALAHLVSEQFQGMLVPGVRGSRHQRYSNLVIFAPKDIWCAWIHSPAAPTELA